MMNYTLTEINENETTMNITEGAVMIPAVKELAKKVAHENNIRILRVCQNGIYLMDYFTKLKRFSIALEIK